MVAVTYLLTIEFGTASKARLPKGLGASGIAPTPGAGAELRLSGHQLADIPLPQISQ